MILLKLLILLSYYENGTCYSDSMSHCLLPVEGPAADAQQTRRPALVSARQLEHALDVPLLEGPAGRGISSASPGAAPPGARGREEATGGLRVGSCPPARARPRPRAGSRARGCCPESRGPGAPRRRRDRGRSVPALAGREAIQEVAHEPRDVLAPLAQRRQDDLDDAQAVVEVLAELAARDPLGESRVRGGEHAHVDRDAAPAADALDLALLEDAQELGLERRAACRRSRRGRASRPAPPRSGPARASTPVATPRSMPKSSDSSRVSGSAAQLIATNGFSARSLRAWIMRATSSLPVPLSPVTSTEICEGATRDTRSSTRRAAGESPTKRRPAAARPVSSRSRRFSSSRRSRSRVRRSRWRRFSIAMPQRPASDTRKRRPPRRRRPAPPRRTSLSASTRTPRARPPPEIRTPIGGRDGRAEELELFARDGGVRGEHVVQELVRAPRRLRRALGKADPRLGAPAPPRRSRQVAARGVEHADDADENVLDQGLLVGQGAERQAGVVERLEKEKPMLGLEVADDRPCRYFGGGENLLAAQLAPPRLRLPGRRPARVPFAVLGDELLGAVEIALRAPRARRPGPAPRRPRGGVEVQERVGRVGDPLLERERLVRLALRARAATPSGSSSPESGPCALRSSAWRLLGRGRVDLGL